MRVLVRRGEEVLVDLAGEGEVGGRQAEEELDVGPQGGDGVGIWEDLFR